MRWVLVPNPTVRKWLRLVVLAPIVAAVVGQLTGIMSFDTEGVKEEALAVEVPRAYNRAIDDAKESLSQTPISHQLDVEIKESSLPRETTENQLFRIINKRLDSLKRTPE